MLLFSRKKKNPKIGKTLTLKDVREAKHVLLFFKALDQQQHSFCLATFTAFVKSSDPVSKTEDLTNAIKEKQENGERDNYTLISNQTKEIYCYLGEHKLTNLPSDYKERPLDWNYLFMAINNNSVRPKGLHFGFIFFFIKRGLFGAGYDNIKQSKFRRKMEELGFKKSIGRDNISKYTNISNSFDFISFTIPNIRFNEKEKRLSSKDQKNLQKQEEIRVYCSELIDYYWQLMMQ